jgi:proteasome lid subunit RPN8/RPN11
MVAQAEAAKPLECCGLLAGVLQSPADGSAESPHGLVRRRYPLVNAAASPVLFESEPRSMLDAVRDIDRQGLEILAVYHSHPTSAPIPSRTDLERNFSPDVINLIVSLAEDPPTMRGWWLSETEFREAEFVVTEGG